MHLNNIILILFLIFYSDEYIDAKVTTSSVSFIKGLCVPNKAASKDIALSIYKSQVQGIEKRKIKIDTVEDHHVYKNVFTDECRIKNRCRGGRLRLDLAKDNCAVLFFHQER